MSMSSFRCAHSVVAELDDHSFWTIERGDPCRYWHPVTNDDGTIAYCGEFEISENTWVYATTQDDPRSPWNVGDLVTVTVPFTGFTVDTIGIIASPVKEYRHPYGNEFSPGHDVVIEWNKGTKDLFFFMPQIARQKVTT